MNARLFPLIAVLAVGCNAVPRANPAQGILVSPDPKPQSATTDAGAGPVTQEPVREVVKGEVVVLTRDIADVDVRNPDPVSNDDVTVSVGSTCSVSSEGTLTVVGSKDGGLDLLVRYGAATILHRKAQPAEDDDRVFCPSGTLFFISKLEYLETTKDPEIGTVLKLLKQEHAAKP